jgi:hypothetical protein
MEFFKECGTAEFPSARANTPDHFGLVSHADLSKFDSGVQFFHQIFDQLAEIYSAVGKKVKDDFRPVKETLYVY